MLAKLVNAVSKDTMLFNKINQHVDQFCQSKDYAYRDESGFLQEEIPLHYIPEYEVLNQQLFDIYAKDIIEIIKKEGYCCYSIKNSMLAIDFISEKGH